MRLNRKFCSILALLLLLSMLMVTFPVSPAVAATGTISINTSTSPVGSEVTMTGFGFTPRSLLTVNFLGRTLPNHMRVSPDGTFSLLLYVSRTAGGIYNVCVTTDAGDTSNMLLFTVTSNLVLDHSSGNVGDYIRVQGSGFNASTSVNVRISDKDWFTAETDEHGSIGWNFASGKEVPSIDNGEYLVVADNAPPVTFRVPRYNWPVSITENYTLASDMAFPDSGFIIEADNITLDLNGHTITGRYAPNPPIGPTSFGILLSRHTGVTIKNGTIQGFSYGLFVDSSNNNLVDGITLTRNADAGLYIVSSDNNIVEDVVSENNGNVGLGGAGIMLVESNNNTIQNVVSTDNKMLGIEILGFNDYPVNNIVKDSVISGNREWGLLLIHVSNSTISGNLIDGNVMGIPRLLPLPPAGLALINSISNIISDNNIRGNMVAGVSLNGSNSNSILNNQIQSNMSPGVTLGNSDDNIILNNRIHKNMGNGIIVGAPEPFMMSTNNLFIGNNLTDNNGRYSIHDLSTGSGTSGTANYYENNRGETSLPDGLIK